MFIDIVVSTLTIADALTVNEDPLRVEEFDAEVNPMCRRICIRIGRTVACRCI